MRVGILSGVRVVELGNAWAGPFAARMLADLGAEVIKVESPSRPDLVRFSVYLDNEPGTEPWERGAHYQKFSRNKKSCILDLANPRGRELFLRLLSVSDIFLENNTPRVREQLQLSDAVLEPTNSELITISMPGFGSSGPYKNFLAYGLTIEGFAGLSSVTGYNDGIPVRSSVPYGDPVAAVYALIAALASLRNRRVNGHSAHVELSQHEALTTLLPDAFIDAQLGRPVGPRSNRDGITYPVQGVLRCVGEDHWVAVSVRDDQFGAVRQLLSVEALEDADRILEALQEWAANHTRDEVTDQLQASGIAAAPSLSPAEMMQHEQVQDLGLYEAVPHPLNRSLPYSRIPLHFSGTPSEPDTHAPLFGEHNEYVFSQLLGLSHHEIDELYELGITSKRPDMA